MPETTLHLPKLSAFIIAKNEAADLPGCLESLKGLTDEIALVDDESTDATREVAQRAGAKVHSRKLDGFGAQKQFALDQVSGDWALSIDADERVTPALAEEIRAVLVAPKADGYELSRAMYFLGHELRYGGVGRDRVLRLFRKSAGKFAPVKVHERVEINGTVAQLQSPLLHYSYTSLQEYVQKCNAYTELAAKEAYARGRRFHAIDHLRPLWEIFVRVFIKAAWVDGRPGLVYAALSAHAAWLRAVKLWELENCRR